MNRLAAVMFAALLAVSPGHYGRMASSRDGAATAPCPMQQSCGPHGTAMGAVAGLACLASFSVFEAFPIARFRPDAVGMREMRPTIS